MALHMAPNKSLYMAPNIAVNITLYIANVASDGLRVI